MEYISVSALLCVAESLRALSHIVDLTIEVGYTGSDGSIPSISFFRMLSMMPALKFLAVHNIALEVVNQEDRGAKPILAEPACSLTYLCIFSHGDRSDYMDYECLLHNSRHTLAHV